MVWARNDQTLEYGYRPVVTTKATADQELYEVVVGNAQGQTETYYTTSEHPFWVKDHGWRKASLLEAGMTLVDRHNEPIQFISQSLTSDIDTVFNIQVQDSETYHIGEFGVWVHNTGCCPVGNMKQFLASDGFGSDIASASQKTSKVYDGQSVYKANSDVGNFIKKNDQLYLDGLHKDHIEVFDKQGNFKAVLNLDGTLNMKKTELARGRKLK